MQDLNAIRFDMLVWPDLIYSTVESLSHAAAGSYLDLCHRVCCQFNVSEVALAQGRAIHHVAPDALDLLSHDPPSFGSKVRVDGSWSDGSQK